MMPEGVVQVRRELCQCEGVDHTDPYAGCPNGHFGPYTRKRGDRLASIAQPIAGAIDSVLGTNLKNCPGCKRTQQNLNNGMSLADAFFDRFWKPKE